MTFLDCIASCNRHDLSRFTPFHMADRAVGWIRSDTLPLLRAYEDIFDFADGIVTLSPRLDTCTARSQALLKVARGLDARDGVLPPWRDEVYPVFTDPAHPEFASPDPTSNSTAEPLAHVTRSAVLFFGVPAWGRASQRLCGGRERAQGVAGTARTGLFRLPRQTRQHGGRRPARGAECYRQPGQGSPEEAGIEAGTIARARPEGGISYTVETPFGLSIGTIFVYDLKLPSAFTPRCHDGEVAEFLLLPAGEVTEMAATTAEALHFKPNSALVILDFLLRHGVLDGASDRAEIAAALGRKA